MKLSNIISRKNRILLAELVRTDFKLRYQASALGYLWSILNPLLLFAILYLVFVYFLGVGRNIEHFPVYLLLGIVLWRFFTEATNNGLKAIVQRGSLIRKINFPRYVIVISGTISSLINLGINLMVVLIFCFINGVTFTPLAFVIIPIVIELYVFALALAFLLAAMNVKFRDTGYIWDVFLQAAFYATPIIYPLQLVYGQGPKLAELLLWNPVAQTIQDARYVLVSQTDTLTMYQISGGWYAYLIPLGIIGVTLVVATLVFKHGAKRFAEDV